MNEKWLIEYWQFQLDVAVTDARVLKALLYLWRHSNVAYRAIRVHRGFKRRLGLKMKTRALIMHDRILRAGL